MEEKDYLIEEIKKVNIKIAEFDSIATIATIENRTIYINRKYPELMCEWVLLHEYVHILKVIITQKNHRENNNDIFEEVITDLITASMGPDLNKNLKTTYMLYYDYVLEYIGLFGEETLKAYFYGYQTVVKKTGEKVLGFFTMVLDLMDEEPKLSIYLEWILSYWRQKE